MTRKEPKFNDDPNTPILASTPKDFVRPDLEPGAQNPPKLERPKQTGSNWLLWLFVVVSLCVSFGMAFFGLEEAGRYQAALTRAENQAKVLEETIDKLNRLQTQGIGELAQSDAQMRQMMASVQTSLAEEVEKKFSNVSKRFEVMSAQLSKNMDSLTADVSLVQDQASSDRARLDEASQTLESLGGQILQINNETTQLSARLESGERTLEKTTKLAEQALDDKTALIAVEVLAEEVATYKQLAENLRRDLQKQQDSSSALISQLEDLRIQVARVDELAPQVSKLSRLIGELDVGRKQITQRIIDLDVRWNEFSRLERVVLDSQQQIQRINSQLNDNAKPSGQ
jgi:predicted  nucleic acid-binding Zn-ribbon protein